MGLFSKEKLYKIYYRFISSTASRNDIHMELISATTIHKALKLFHNKHPYVDIIVVKKVKG